MLNDWSLPFNREAHFGQRILMGNYFVIHATEWQDQSTDDPGSIFASGAVNDQRLLRLIGQMQQNLLVRRGSIVEYIGVSLDEALPGLALHQSYYESEAGIPIVQKSIDQKMRQNGINSNLSTICSIIPISYSQLLWTVVSILEYGNESSFTSFPLNLHDLGVSITSFWTN